MPVRAFAVLSKSKAVEATFEDEDEFAEEFVDEDVEEDEVEDVFPWVLVAFELDALPV